MPTTTTSFVKKGVLVGTKGVVFCKVDADASNGTTYDDEIKSAPGAIEVGLAYQLSEDQLGADDVAAYEIENSVDGIEATLTMASLGVDACAYLLGHSVDSKGVMIENKDDVAPYVAMGFAAKRSDGSTDNIWLYKGKFKPSDQTFRTREKGKVNWQTPKITGTFAPRISDGRMKAVVNSTDTGVDATALAGFFDSVYEATFTPAP